MAAHFSSPADEYLAATTRSALFDRCHRGLLIAHGPDARSWLHNLVTNAVKSLDDNDGNYAFAIDLKGRTQFDLNILVVNAELWLDIDFATLPAAKAHLERFLITEKVVLRDASPDFGRIAVVGPDSPRVAANLGVGNFSALPSLSSTWVSLAPSDSPARLVRNHFTGLPGFELIIPAASLTTWWDRLALDLGVFPAGVQTAQVLRIESGIPEWGFDIDDKTIPPETGQVDRGISYKKGCYLGQEVIERMRSLGAPARRLVRFSIPGIETPPTPAPVLLSDREVGRLTSAARHPLRDDCIGLGYLRSNVIDTAGFSLPGDSRPLTLRT